MFQTVLFYGWNQYTKRRDAGVNIWRIETVQKLLKSLLKTKLIKFRQICSSILALLFKLKNIPKHIQFLINHLDHSNIISYSLGTFFVELTSSMFVKTVSEPLDSISMHIEHDRYIHYLKCFIQQLPFHTLKWTKLKKVAIDCQFISRSINSDFC